MEANYCTDFRGPIPAATWIDPIPVPQVIDDFLKHGYARAHYAAMARVVEGILGEKLKEGGVQQFKLSSRAKDKKSLKEKLLVRHEKKHYKDAEEIKKDIVDLAGVRIILYMPTTEGNNKVKEVIHKEWTQGVVEKSHLPPRNIEEDEDEENRRNRKYRPRHLGYRAKHYRVPMRENQSGKDDYEWLENDQVEIQVVSAFTHAWAEAGHDIFYKSYAYGPPTFDEERTLDVMNSLIQSGDILLEQFHSSLVKRTSAPFEHREQLTGFLRTFFAFERDMVEDDDDLECAQFPRSEGIYILFKFLEKEKLNCPMAVRRPLTELQYPFEHQGKERLITQSFKPVPKLAADMSVVICLIRHLLREKPYKRLQQQQQLSAREMCAIMMSTLTILQFSLGEVVDANRYLQKIEMTTEEVESINFLLDSNKRHATLLGEHDEAYVKPSLLKAWEWFHKEAENPFSFCGLLFRLAEMGCKKELNACDQIDQLHICPLSRSSTGSMESNSAEPSAS